MKFKSILLLFAVACALSSCFNETTSQTTPMMQLYYGYVNPQFVGDSLVGAKDTLKYYHKEELNMTYTDTLQLGDTVMIPAIFVSGMNNLVSVVATVDTVRVKLWFNLDMNESSVQNVLLPESQPEKGSINFKPMHDLASFPIYILPLEAGSHVIRVTVTSDSQYPKSDAIFTLPVVVPPAEDEGTGEDPNEGTGEDPNEGTGEDPNEGTGEDPNEGTGEDPNEGTGDDPNEGTGEDPNEGTGEDPNEGTGEEPNEGTGEEPNEGTEEEA